MVTAGISPSCRIEALTPRGSTVSTLVSIATGELHLRGSLGLKEGKSRLGAFARDSQHLELRGGVCVCVRFYLTGVKLEKSAQPVSAFELAAAEELQPASADAGDGGAGTAALGAVDVPVSIGMSSKLAVHTGPESVRDPQVTQRGGKSSQSACVQHQQATASITDTKSISS